MKYLIALLLMTSLLIANKLDLNGLYLYNAKDVLSYNNNADNRKVLLIFSSKNCSHCVVYKNQLSSLDYKTKQFLGTKYIFAISEDDQYLNHSFNVTSTPTTFILSSNKQMLIEPMIGEPQNIEEFISYLMYLSQK